MADAFWQRHENRIRNVRVQLFTLLLLAIIGTFFPLLGVFKPAGEALGVWWQRGGTPTVVFAFLAQNKAQALGALITPGSFTSDEMESLRSKYKANQRMGNIAASALTVSGTAVWGYGDLLLNWISSFN